MLFTAIMETDCDNRIFIKSVRLFAAERVDWVRWIGCNQLNPQNGELPRARVPEAAIGNKDVDLRQRYNLAQVVSFPARCQSSRFRDKKA